MGITEKDRLDLRQRLSEVLGEASAAVMMEAIPPVDYTALATRDDLALTRRELRAEMAELRVDIDRRFAQIDQRFAHIDQQFADVHREFARMDVNRARDVRLMVGTQVGSMLGLAALVVGLG